MNTPQPPIAPDLAAMEEFARHGELTLWQRLTSHPQPVIFDVGANEGNWSRMVRTTSQPLSTIHMFEPFPDTYQRLIRSGLDSRMIPNSYGLSNCLDSKLGRYVQDNNKVSTLVHGIEHTHAVPQRVLLCSGDIYCEMAGVEQIDFLKIDTEGHEYPVVLGFEGLLKRGAIGLIQFEHGWVDVLTKTMVLDFYRLLEPLGFTHIGKLTPDGVSFTPYTLFEEEFEGGDYLCVHQSQEHLVNILRRR